MQPRVACVVPARLGSTRFFGKLLAPIFGKPVVVHALERARGAGCFDAVVCLTDSPEIGSAVAEHGFPWALSGEARNGTERIGKHLAALDALGVDADLFVNLQGDEPAFPEDGLRALCAALRREPDRVHLLVHDNAPTDEEIANPNRVKVSLDGRNFVTDIVRLPDPSRPATDYRLQLGAYGYSRAYLDRYALATPAAREIELSHEILRLWNERPVRAHGAPAGASVDAPEDLAAAIAALTTATRPERQNSPQGAPA
jgi:3-deoxy-manno-octulosonate cytidylyltransferase (CMP-KDO synthetase)